MDEVRVKPAYLRALNGISVLFGIGLIIGAYVWAFGNRLNVLNVQAESIIMCEVEEGPFSEYVTFPAIIIPFRTIYLDAYISGRVDSVHGEVGDMLQVGDKIITLSNPNVIMDIMQREAEIFEQSNYLRNTQVAMEQKRTNLQSQMLETDFRLTNLTDNYHRKSELFNKGMIAEAEFKSVKYEYEYLMKKRELILVEHTQDSIYRAGQIRSLEHGLERMEQNLGFFKRNIDQLIIRAPVSGVLTSFDAEIGEQISSGRKLGQIDDLSGYKMRIQADEHWLNRIQAGMHGSTFVSNEKASLLITKVYPEVINRVFTFEMAFVDSIPQDLRQGQSLYVEIIFDRVDHALMIRKGNFYAETGGGSVYV
ncbi:HlyD family efflux transporter periplasmic adaptor subunit, partial [bacterium]|nr:HlyD family efflux transporter periplasmic adaptor subunit [bacterium]